jgi:CRISPR system Cascade subunit CasB
MSDKDAATLAADWWRGLQPYYENGQRNPFGDRAALARLRRCGTVGEAMQDVATMELFRKLDYRHPGQLTDVALTAAVLASVRSPAPPYPSFPRAIGPTGPAAPETAAVKPLRFRRLMEAETPDDRLTAFRRAVALAGHTANLRSLAEALLFWREDLRLRWIFDYWNAADRPVAAPAAAVPAA